MILIRVDILDMTDSERNAWMESVSQVLETAGEAKTLLLTLASALPPCPAKEMAVMRATELRTAIEGMQELALGAVMRVAHEENPNFDA